MLEVAAVFLIVILARSILVLVRALSPAESILRITRTWPVFWRCLAIGSCSGSSRTNHNSCVSTLSWRTNTTPGCPDGRRSWCAAGSFSGLHLMAMIGLMLGMGAGRFLNEARPPGRRPVTLFVVLAGLAGVLIMAASDFYAR